MQIVLGIFLLLVVVGFVLAFMEIQSLKTKMSTKDAAEGDSSLSTIEEVGSEEEAGQPESDGEDVVVE
jgi:hypothetical protein